MIKRICKCGCGNQFQPPVSRPGQEYIFGHKPASARKKQPITEVQSVRRTLDYKIAAKTAKLELGQVTARIDDLDDEIEVLQKTLHAREAEKEALTETHLLLRASLATLETLSDEKDIQQGIRESREILREAEV